MLNRLLAPCALTLVWLWLAAGTEIFEIDADEVSCLQSGRPLEAAEAPRQTEPVRNWASIRGRWLQTFLHWYHARPAVMLRQVASKIDGTDATVMFMVFGAVLLCFFGMLACFARMALKDLMKEDLKEVEEAGAKAARTHAEVPFVQPAEGLKNEALPAICPQFMSSMHQPIVVPLNPIQAGKEWTLKVYSQHSKRAILSASLLRAGSDRKRSFLEVRNNEKNQLLGTITSNLEILIPDGRRYGRLVAHRGEYLLQEDSGRDARWSMAEDDGILTAVWLPRRGTGQRIYQDLKDGFHRLGKLLVNHRQRGCLLATVARPDGSNGHRLELMSVSGVDAVLVLLCALGLLTFGGMFEVIDRAEFQAEKAGPAKADPSPAVNSSLSAATGTSSLGAAQFASDCYSSMSAPQFATDCYSSLHPPRLATECYSSMSAPQFATDCNCLGPAPEGGSKEDHPVAGAK